jgi:hypothetical protein
MGLKFSSGANKMKQSDIDKLGLIYANLREIVNKLDKGTTKDRLNAAMETIEDVLFQDCYK